MIPSFEAIDHIGITVPDISEAVSFFVEALGAELMYEEGPFEDATGNEMWDAMRVHPRAVERLAMLRLGTATTIELLEFDYAERPASAAPDVAGESIGHLGLRVGDMEAAIGHLRRIDGVEVLAGPAEVEEGAVKGLRWIYFLTPWKSPMELVQFPPDSTV